MAQKEAELESDLNKQAGGSMQVARQADDEKEKEKKVFGNYEVPFYLSHPSEITSEINFQYIFGISVAQAQERRKKGIGRSQRKNG